MARRFLRHFICWALFVFYEVSLARYMGDHFSLLNYGCFYALNIILFYFNALVILRRISAIGSFPAYALTGILILIELVVYSYLSVVLNNAFRGLKGTLLVAHIEPAVFMSAGWRGIYFIALSSAYFSVIRAINALKETNEAKIKELNAQNKNEKLNREIVSLQNAYLQAQVNPHFLFNTLSFIYNQAEEGHPDTAKNISLLSEIMQYSLTSIERDGKVPLCQELDQIRRYVNLNLSRFDNTLFLKEEIYFDKEAADARIPPLILFTFVENVFKHSDMTHEEFPATIEISYREGLLTFFTSNKKRRSRRDNREHVGLKNAFLRLNDSFPAECIHCSIKEDNIVYEFNLKLRL